MLERTAEEWRLWVRGLATPLEWQDVVIRAAITLKLCQHEPTGAIVAALTTSLPEHANSGRNWDYRYCWVRNALYGAGAQPARRTRRAGGVSRLSAQHRRRGEGRAHPAAVRRRRRGAADRGDRHDAAGYRGMGPVRVGNQAYEQIQHDAYGQIVLSNVQAFFDHRLLRMATREDFQALEKVGERAWEMYDKPDAGLWELRTKAHVHTYSAAMCWAACDRLGNAARALGLADRETFWNERAKTMRARIEEAAWRPDTARVSATFGGDDLDASIIQLLDLRFLSPRRPPLPLDAVRGGGRAAPRQPHAALRDGGRFRPAAHRVQRLHLLADRGAARHRPRASSARPVRGDGGAAHPRGAAVRGYRSANQ
ncbi:glycoside hydrolase family 15 protein [Sphingomonas sp. MMS24-JH45]